MDGFVVIPDPFPHLIIDDWINPYIVTKINEQWPKLGPWTYWDNPHEKKRILSNPSVFPPAILSTVQRFGDPEFVKMLETEFSMSGLRPDLVGGGLHETFTGGFLKPHIDFNRLGTEHRRLNALLFLNEDWTDDLGGELVLGLDPWFIQPLAGRLVVFECSPQSWHSAAPWMSDEPRRSIAVYYFSAEKPPWDEPEHSTVWA